MQFFVLLGALSAYRKSALTLNDLEKWKNQTFFKKPANIGQDRALTNILLKKDLKVVYQKSAKANTNVPTTYKGLCKMFIRWIRGDIRENIQMITFIHKQNIFTMINLLMQFIWLFLPAIVLPTLVKFIIANPINSLIIILFSTLFWNILPFIYSKSKHSFTFGFLNLVTMIWIIPYCWLTIWKSHWRNKIRLISCINSMHVSCVFGN